jgi:hypothetical protein
MCGCIVICKFTDIPEKYIASVFKVKVQFDDSSGRISENSISTWKGDQEAASKENLNIY